MLLAGLAVILGIWMDLAALGIAVFCLVAGFVMHRFWAETEPQARQAEMAHFFKNVSIAGGALVLAALGGDLPYTVTDGVFS